MRWMRGGPVWPPFAAAVMLTVASLTGCGGGVLSPDLVVVNGGEPPNPLI
ncbi:MAG: oligopeptide transport system substrate-binding protein, partial [Mycobacterium sp.]|nr:oligopeptide transport system substrate-binding protein [Mycobacterium sp.]